MLTEACRILRDKGCAAAYGPMDGSTWKSYRFVTWSDGSPPFFMEPQQPPEWPLYWQEAGFVPCHEYISTLVTDLDFSDPRLAKARLRLQQAGISLRPVNLERFEDELKDVYQLSLEAFKKNILYTPIDLAAFLRQYLPLAESIDRHFMLLARDKTDLCCGFVFAIPDLLQRQQGMVPERVIIKTLAVHPGRQYAGLGAVLVDAIQQRARTHGFGAAIHALMHAGNVSTNIGKNSRIIRRYTLFSKTLV